MGRYGKRASESVLNEITNFHPWIQYWWRKTTRKSLATVVIDSTLTAHRLWQFLSLSVSLSLEATTPSPAPFLFLCFFSFLNIFIAPNPAADSVRLLRELPRWRETLLLGFFPRGLAQFLPSLYVVASLRVWFDQLYGILPSLPSFTCPPPPQSTTPFDLLNGISMDVKWKIMFI